MSLRVHRLWDMLGEASATLEVVVHRAWSFLWETAIALSSLPPPIRVENSQSAQSTPQTFAQVTARESERLCEQCRVQWALSRLHHKV
mmetsp:Transcript_173139/g.555206  ORF Transcript_173139/g.555206 Transcript_173139/m.555206 type:complete len:88 (-) Transcript_173139:198-461(-)